MDATSMRGILTINRGSSSIKSALFDAGEPTSPLLSARLDRIGLDDGGFRVFGADGSVVIERSLELKDHGAALQVLLEWLREQADARDLRAVGHRIVHGGPGFVRPCLVTSELMDGLRELAPLAPDHIPHEIAAIEGIREVYPSVPQMACFDTSFHRGMASVAQAIALPANLRQARVLRYGFHGLSYEYVVGELRRIAGEAAGNSRLIVAHLGNGASMAAIRGGMSVDTTMGFTPTGGLVMGTRSGDLDPGVLTYLMRECGLSVAEVDDVVNRRCGLAGVSGISSDMRDLLARASNDAKAAAAVDLFCYQARKFLGGLTTVLGGLDQLVFTAGIGERAAPVRHRICDGLDYLGIHVDLKRNESHSPIISPEDSPVTVRVLPTNEELMIARHARDLLRDQAASG